MRDQSHTLSRRGLILGLCAIPSLAVAHAGHGVAHVVSDAQVIKVRDANVTVVLTIFNSGTQPVLLGRVTADGATPVSVPNGLIVSGALEAFRVQFKFTHAVPSVFPVTLDFGQDGQDAVVVTV